MKYILVILMTAGLCACGGVVDENAQNNGGGNTAFGDPSSGDVIISDYNNCGYSTPNGLSITSHGWGLQTRSTNGLTLTSQLFFNQNGVTLVNICSMAGHTLSATARTSARFSNNSVEFLAPASNSTEMKGEDFQMTCSARIDSAWMNYGFKGRCLELSRPGYTQKILLVPL